MNDLVRSFIHEADRTLNRDRGDFSGAPTEYLRGFYIEPGQRPRPFKMTGAMMREAFAIAERNPEDVGVYLPPPIPSPRAPEPMPTWLQWGIIAAALAAGYALGSLA